MRNYIQAVSEFHQAFNHPIVDVPQIPDAARVKLRLDLLQEELDELKAAVASGDLVEIADALCDTQYVLSGAVLEFGFTFIFNEMFDAVHASNMSKTCSTEEEAQAEVNRYRDFENTTVTPVKRGNAWLLYDDNGKTRKPLSYKAVDLKTIIQPLIDSSK